MCETRGLRGHRRQDQGFGAESCQPARLAVDVRQLRAADVVMVEDGVRRTRDDTETMLFQDRFHLVAPVGQKARRAGLDRSLANRRGL